MDVIDLVDSPVKDAADASIRGAPCSTNVVSERSDARIGSAAEPVCVWLVPLALGSKRREILCAGVLRLGGKILPTFDGATHIVVAETISRERTETLLTLRAGVAPTGVLVSCAWLVQSLSKGIFLPTLGFDLRAEHENKLPQCQVSDPATPSPPKRRRHSHEGLTADFSSPPLPLDAAGISSVPATSSEHGAAKIGSLPKVGVSPLARQNSLDGCLNAELLHEFDTLRAHYAAKKDQRWREVQYKKIVAALRFMPFRIVSVDDLNRPEASVLAGSHTRTRVEEFLRRGSIQLAQQVQHDPKALAISDLINFGTQATNAGTKKYSSYVGASTAEHWYDHLGIRTLKDLATRVESDKNFLTHNQRVMWDFREDFSQRIPRQEVELIAEVVRGAFPRTTTELEVCGSYCRGAPDCGDVDLLVCCALGEDPRVLCARAVATLTGAGFLTSTLRDVRDASEDAVGQWQGGCRLASLAGGSFHDYKRYRRLDIKVYLKKHRAFAQLYFGSGQEFNRAIRLFATRQGFCLSDHGVRKVVRGKNERGELVTLWEGPYEEDPTGEDWATEASIFAFLGLPYIALEARAVEASVPRLENLAAAQSGCVSDSLISHGEQRTIANASSGACSLVSCSGGSGGWRDRGLVGLDCEFVGVGRNTSGIGGDRNALARVSVVSYAGVVLLDTFVRVDEEVVDFRIHITGITQSNLDSGVSFAEACKEVKRLLEGRLVVGHSVAHDFKVLSICPPAAMIRDTASCKHLRVPNQGRSLKALAEHHLGKQVQNGTHCSVEDARTAVELYRLVETLWDDFCPVSEAVPAPTPAAPHLRAAGESLHSSSNMPGGHPTNEILAAGFERRAVGSWGYARDHYARVARTLRALPFAVESLEDLDRPELRCVGNGKVRTELQRLIASNI